MNREDEIREWLAQAERYRAWSEFPPYEPTPAGDIGGDNQVGGAWSRRYARRRQDGKWAVIDDFWYPASGVWRDRTALVNTTEFLVCSDIMDPGGSEEWSDSLWRTVDTEGDPTSQTAKKYSQESNVFSIYRWSGDDYNPRRIHPVDADDEHTLPSKNGLELMARLMEAGVAQTQAITNQVLENYRLEALRARAELRAVREDVLAALNGDYVPSHHVLINRLYPNDARIGRARAAIEEEKR